jgi:hypothetical protein
MFDNLKSINMDKRDTAQIPIMEKLGLRYLKKLRAKTFLDRIDSQTYILDNDERAKINRIERQAIINVVIAGIISSIVSGLAGFLADPLIDLSSGFFSSENMLYWSIVLGATIIASMFEIFYIYYDVMSKTHDLTVAAHLELFPDGKDEKEIAASIVRAALELPNKRDSDIRIDPKRESSKVVIFLGTILYKLKVSASSFLFRAFIKRMLGRAISRAWLNFMAVPVCAFWNGMVCWLVIREVKIRVLGPSAAFEIIDRISKLEYQLSDSGKLALLRSIGSCIVRTADLHPNLELMYRSFDEQINESANEVLDDSHLFLKSLKELNIDEKRIVLETLVYSSIIDGKVTYREKNLLTAAYKICEIPFDFNKIKSILKRFRSGALLDFSLPV